MLMLSVLSTPAVPFTVVQGAYRTFCSGQQQQPGSATVNEPAVVLLTVQSSGWPAEFVLDDATVFSYLAAEWRRERGATSSTTEMILSPSYQRIIAMGLGVIPLILLQMDAEGDDPDYWFWALHIITGANPVAEEDDGDFVRMAESWRRWARGQGYAW